MTCTPSKLIPAQHVYTEVCKVCCHRLASQVECSRGQEWVPAIATCTHRPVKCARYVKQMLRVTVRLKKIRFEKLYTIEGGVSWQSASLVLPCHQEIEPMRVEWLGSALPCATIWLIEESDRHVIIHATAHASHRVVGKGKQMSVHFGVTERD